MGLTQDSNPESISLSKKHIVLICGMNFRDISAPLSTAYLLAVSRSTAYELMDSYLNGWGVASKSLINHYRCAFTVVITITITFK